MTGSTVQSLVLQLVFPGYFNEDSLLWQAPYFSSTTRKMSAKGLWTKLVN
jgi:hypothetical protein